MWQKEAEIEANRALLKYRCYYDYLDSLATAQDYCYLQNSAIRRVITELGFRSGGETLSKIQFEERVKAVWDYLTPAYKPYVLTSEFLTLQDPFLIELAIRERPNRLGIISTIIFLILHTKAGHKVSGFIDYSSRLAQDNFTFKKLSPNRKDLSYYHWRTRFAISNETPNYKVLGDPVKGVQFQHKMDRQIVNLQEPKRVCSKMYDLVLVFDHFIREKK